MPTVNWWETEAKKWWEDPVNILDMFGLFGSSNPYAPPENPLIPRASGGPVIAPPPRPKPPGISYALRLKESMGEEVGFDEEERPLYQAAGEVFPLDQAKFQYLMAIERRQEEIKSEALASAYSFSQEFEGTDEEKKQLFERKYKDEVRKAYAKEGFPRPIWGLSEKQTEENFRTFKPYGTVPEPRKSGGPVKAGPVNAPPHRVAGGFTMPQQKYLVDEAGEELYDPNPPGPPYFKMGQPGGPDVFIPPADGMIIPNGGFPKPGLIRRQAGGPVTPDVTVMGPGTPAPSMQSLFAPTPPVPDLTPWQQYTLRPGGPQMTADPTTKYDPVTGLMSGEGGWSLKTPLTGPQYSVPAGSTPALHGGLGQSGTTSAQDILKQNYPDFARFAAGLGTPSLPQISTPPPEAALTAFSSTAGPQAELNIEDFLPGGTAGGSGGTFQDWFDWVMGNQPGTKPRGPLGQIWDNIQNNPLMAITAIAGIISNILTQARAGELSEENLNQLKKYSGMMDQFAQAYPDLLNQALSSGNQYNALVQIYGEQYPELLRQAVSTGSTFENIYNTVLSQVPGKYLDLFTKYEQMTPQDTMAGIRALQDPLSRNLTNSMMRQIQAQLGERGLAQAPGIMSEELAQALAPYQLELLKQAQSAYFDTLRLPMQVQIPNLQAPLPLPQQSFPSPISAPGLPAQIMPYELPDINIAPIIQSLAATGGTGGPGGPGGPGGTGGTIPPGPTILPLPTPPPIGGPDFPLPTPPRLPLPIPLPPDVTPIPSPIPGELPPKERVNTRVTYPGFEPEPPPSLSSPEFPFPIWPIPGIDIGGPEEPPPYEEPPVEDVTSTVSYPESPDLDFPGGPAMALDAAVRSGQMLAGMTITPAALEAVTGGAISYGIMGPLTAFLTNPVTVAAGIAIGLFLGLKSLIGRGRQTADAIVPTQQKVDQSLAQWTDSFWEDFHTKEGGMSVEEFNANVGVLQGISDEFANWVDAVQGDDRAKAQAKQSIIGLVDQIIFDTTQAALPYLISPEDLALRSFMNPLPPGVFVP